MIVDARCRICKTEVVRRVSKTALKAGYREIIRLCCRCHLRTYHRIVVGSQRYALHERNLWKLGTKSKKLKEIDRG